MQKILSSQVHTYLLKTLLFHLLFLFIAFNVKSQKHLSSNAKISLLTCEPGQEIYSLFGHSAIWVYDVNNNINTVFNYGTFDYDAPNFTSNFLKGKLSYWLATENANRFFVTYDYLKRGVTENQILLDSIQMNMLYGALLENALPENKMYLYDFFFDNCSTRIGDLLENELGTLSYEQDGNKSLRDQLHEYLEGRDWTSFGIDLIIGSKADINATAKQQMFLPDYLQSNLISAKRGESTILGNSKVIVSHQRAKVHSFWITPLFLFTLLLLLEVIILGSSLPTKWLILYDFTWLAIVVLASVVLMFMWLGTDHQACSQNYNLICFNPLIIGWLFIKWLNINHTYLTWASVLIVLPMLFLPFIKMSIQNLPSATLLIAIITAIKIFRNGNISNLRKWV